MSEKLREAVERQMRACEELDTGAAKIAVNVHWLRGFFADVRAALAAPADAPKDAPILDVASAHGGNESRDKDPSTQTREKGRCKATGIEGGEQWTRCRLTIDHEGVHDFSNAPADAPPKEVLDVRPHPLCSAGTGGSTVAPQGPCDGRDSLSKCSTPECTYPDCPYGEWEKKQEAARPEQAGEVMCPDCGKPAKFIKARTDLYTCPDQACDKYGSFFESNEQAGVPEGPSVEQVAAILCPGYSHTARGLRTPAKVKDNLPCQRCLLWAQQIRGTLDRLHAQEAENERHTKTPEPEKFDDGY